MGRFEMQQRRIVEGLDYFAVNVDSPKHSDDSLRPRSTPVYAKKRTLRLANWPRRS
jgi:hypothetical protein